jgi:HK97 family phage major capsid protein
VKSLELKRKKSALVAEQKTLATKAELTEDERKRWDAIKTELDALEREIKFEEDREEVARREAENSGSKVSKNEERDLKRYSFVRAIQSVIKGKLEGLEAEMHQEAVREMSAQGGEVSGIGVPSIVLRMGGEYKKRADITTATAPLVQTNIVGFIDALYAKMLLVQMGAQTISGLKGNLSIPRVGTKATAAWATEVANAADAGSDTEAVSVTAKRLACYQDISKQLVFQSEYSVEQLIRGLFIKAMQLEIDAASIKGATNGPTGLLATSGIGDVAGGTNGLAPTNAHMLALIKEVAVDNADIGALGFLTNPKARWKLQSTAIETGHPERVWARDVQDMLLGFMAGVTTQVPGDLDKGTSEDVCSAIIFGNWNDLVIANFGIIDITVDEKSQALANKIRIVLNSFWDSYLAKPASFAAMKDALCNS